MAVIPHIELDVLPRLTTAQHCHQVGERRADAPLTQGARARGRLIKRLTQDDGLRQGDQQRAGGSIQTHNCAVRVRDHQSFAQAGEDRLELGRAARRVGSGAIAPAPRLNGRCGHGGQP